MKLSAVSEGDLRGALDLIYGGRDYRPGLSGLGRKESGGPVDSAGRTDSGPQSEPVAARPRHRKFFRMGWEGRRQFTP